MKTQILNIAISATLAITTPLALAEDKSFPEAGRSYGVRWAQDAKLTSGQIKVLRKGEAPWIFVEYTHPPTGRQPWQRVTQPGDDKPEFMPPEKKDITEKIWINTQWIVTATEVDSEKK